MTQYFDRARMMVGRAQLIGDFDKSGDELVGFVSYESLQEQRVMMPPKAYKPRTTRTTRTTRTKRARRTAKALEVAAKLRDRKRRASAEAHA